MKEIKNMDIRKYSKGKQVCLYEISERMGYSHETVFSRILRHELPQEKKTEIMRIIDELAAEQQGR